MFKNRFSKKNKIENIKNEFKKYKQIANDYIEILRKIDRGQLDSNDFEFLEMNSGILQMQLNYFKLGKGTFRRPFGLGTYHNFQFIANFPALFKNRVNQDEALSFISGIKSALSTYIQLIDDLLNSDQKTKEFIKKISRRSYKIKNLSFDKPKISEVIFLGIYVTSFPFLVNPNTFLLGIIMNLFAMITIFIFSMIND